VRWRFFPEGVIYKKPTSDILPRCFLLGFKISQSGPGLGHLAGRREPAEDGKAQAFAQTHGIVQGGLDYLEIIASSDQGREDILRQELAISASSKTNRPESNRRNLLLIFMSYSFPYQTGELRYPQRPLGRFYQSQAGKDSICFPVNQKHNYHLQNFLSESLSNQYIGRDRGVGYPGIRFAFQRS
jgi:hypothetical protein